MNNHYKVIIIGAGPAGLTAGIYTSRAELSPLIIAGSELGGQLNYTSEVENYPGFPDGIMGSELMRLFQKQALAFGSKLVSGTVTKVDFGKRPFRVFAGDEKYTGDSIIIATGASAKWLGFPSEQRLRGKGVSACATCDGRFFKNKKVIIVGGGDSAMEEADFLSRFADKVTVVHRKDEFRASKILQERIFDNPKIDIIWNSEVIEVLGKDKVNGIKLKNIKSGEESELACEGLFLAIGHSPNTDIFKGQLEIDQKGYLQVKDCTRTDVDGVFAAGDVRDFRYRQAITAAGFGCMAALDCEKWLAANS